MSVLGMLRGVVRSRAALHLEILALRHPLQVLQRSRSRRLRLAKADRWLWAWLSAAWSGWRTALVIVKPETVIAWSVEEYIAAAGPGLERQGFYERELHRTTDAFGALLHGFSTYDSKRTPDSQPFARGINSFQLYNDGARWWIVTIFWDAEAADKPIPAKYLSR